jgi:ADP-ribosylglycohydrolase
MPLSPIKLGEGSLLNRFKGCLLGLAIGDALGAPVEFLQLDKIKDRYGEKGIVDFDSWNSFKPGTYTDDTQLSLATAKGCINAHLNLLREGESHSLDFIYKRYMRWLESLKDHHQVRHPGYTCMHVLQSGERGSIENPINTSTEATGLLRTAPVGLAFPPGMAFREAKDYAALTHGHPSAYYAAGFLAEIIAHIVEGKALQDAIELSIEQLVDFENHKDLMKHIESALELFIDQSPPEESIPKLGEGTTAAEVLAAGIFCSLKFVFDFPDGVKAAVNQSGNSSSTGLVTGAILGTFLGNEAIPENWISSLENSQKISEMAEDMFKIFKQGERISFEKYSLEQ